MTTLVTIENKYLIIFWVWEDTWNMKVKLRPNLCNLMDYTRTGILQVAFPFSRGSLKPRDWTQVSHIAGGFFTSWATREAQEY